MKINDFKIEYIVVYVFLALISLFISIEIDFKKNFNRKISYFFSIVFILLFAFLFGMRDESVGPDTIMYKWQFEHYDILPIDIDFLFSYLLIFVNKITGNYKIFFLTMALLYLLPILRASMIFGKEKQTNLLLMIFSFSSLFFFQSLGSNIIRQAVGLSFFLLGTAYYIKEKKITYKSLIPFFLAVGFHFTSIVPVILLLLIVLFKNIKLNYYYYLYVLCLGLSAINIGILNFSSYLSFLMVDERRSGYLGGNKDAYIIGFKPQFVAFNTLFLILFTFVNKKYGLDKYYEYLLKFFLLMSSIFFFMFQIPYSDRWGVMSWIMIPFLLAPMFKPGNKPKVAFAMSVLLICIFIFFSNY